MIQAEDRVHRIGQVKCVSVYYMIGEGTLDSLIYPRLKLKSSVISSVIDSGCPKTFEITNTLKLSIKQQNESILHARKVGVRENDN